MPIRGLEPRRLLAFGNTSRRLRSLAGAVAIATAVAIAWIPIQRTEAEPPPGGRTAAKIAHERYVIGTCRASLATYLAMAEKQGRVVHLDATALEASGILPMTAATDPYDFSELAHIEHAQRELADYLAPADRSLGTLQLLFPAIRKAIHSLERVLASLDRDKGRKP